MTLQPCRRGIKDATRSEMECAYEFRRIARIDRIGWIRKIGLQVVDVATQSLGHAIVIDLPKVRIKRGVFLHHEDDVVHSLQTARGDRKSTRLNSSHIP